MQCFFFFSKFQSGDDNEELTQDLNGNQNYENGDIEMDAGFEGEYWQQLILLSDTFMYQPGFELGCDHWGTICPLG